MVPREAYRGLSMAPSVSCVGFLVGIFKTPVEEYYSQGCINNKLQPLVSLFTYFDEILPCLPFVMWVFGSKRITFAWRYIYEIWGNRLMPVLLGLHEMFMIYVKWDQTKDWTSSYIIDSTYLL